MAVETTPRAAANRVDHSSEPQPRAKASCEPPHQLRQAGLKRPQAARTALLASSCPGQHTSQQAAMLSLQGREAWKRCGQADLFGIAGVYARHQRIEKRRRSFAAEPAASKLGDAFLGAGRGHTASRGTKSPSSSAPTAASC